LKKLPATSRKGGPEKEGFSGEKYSQIRHISREKSRVKSSFLDHRFLQLARFGEVLVLKDSKSTCLMKLAKTKKKTLVGTGSSRARNSSQNLVRREEHHGDCVNKKFGDW
jgi:hypothetical protein